MAIYVLGALLLVARVFQSQNQLKSDFKKNSEQLIGFFTKLAKARAGLAKTDRFFQVIEGVNSPLALAEFEKLKVSRDEFLGSLKDLASTFDGPAVKGASEELQNGYLGIVDLGPLTERAYLDQLRRPGNKSTSAAREKIAALTGDLESLNQKVLSLTERETINHLDHGAQTVMKRIGFAFAILLFLLGLTNWSLGGTAKKIASGSEGNNELSFALKKLMAEIFTRTKEQATLVHKMVSALDEVSALSGQNVSGIDEVAKKARGSRKLAEKGHELAHQVVLAIEAIRQENENLFGEIRKSNERMTEVIKIINDISEKTAIIDDIVFETKLLSFNASIEAARAGEHGHGFSVVATEIGNLARLSGVAAQEITALISASTQTVRAVVKETNESMASLMSNAKENIDNGATVAQQCGANVEQVAGNAKEMTNELNKVRDAVMEHASGIFIVSKTMDSVKMSTQKVALATEQSSDCLKKLTVYSQELKQQASRLGAVRKKAC